MDAKITKKRLGHMLSYDWIKMIALAVAMILVWSLVFSCASTKITPAQEFYVYNYAGTYTGNGYSGFLKDLKKDGGLSYDVLEVNSFDLTSAGNEMNTVLEARLQTNQGDIMFAQKLADEKAEYPTDGEETYHPNALQKFLTAYPSTVMEIADEKTGLLARMNAYLSPFFEGELTSESATLKDEVVESEFLARVKRLKDKRFRSDKQKKSGVEQEKERILTLRKNYIDFLSYVEEDIIRLEEVEFYAYNYDGTYVKRSGTYAVNLAPVKEGKDYKELQNVVYGYKKVTEEEVTKDVRTSEDMCVMLLDVAGSKYEYSIYETISFVCKIVEGYLL